MYLTKTQEDKLISIKDMLTPKEQSLVNQYYELKKYNSPVGSYLHRKLEDFLEKKGTHQ